MTVDASPSLRRPAQLQTPLLFIEHMKQKPYLKFSYDHGRSETNAVYSPHKVHVGDARNLAPALDVHGFELVRRRPGLAERGEDEQEGELGRHEAAQLVADATGASRVHVFDQTRRSSSADARRQPSTRVHNDYTPASAAARIRDLFAEEAETLLAGDFAFVNVWRPIRRPAVDWPLALCDARSMDPNDLIATDIIYPDRVGELYGATYSPGQRWFYVPNMQLDEALLIKCHDTRAGVARFAPHTAFQNPLAPPGAPPRESIEFRTIAFFG